MRGVNKVIGRKHCQRCMEEFNRHHKDSEKQWAGRKFCSITCRNKSTPKTPVADRFWLHVDKGDDSVCWKWAGSTDGRGYGQINSGDRGIPLKAHRVSWEIHNGLIPDGMVICHSCDNPICVNPAHLFLGTQLDNMQDCSRKNRLNGRSRENLRPGAHGFLGAGPKSSKEMRKCEA